MFLYSLHGRQCFHYRQRDYMMTCLASFYPIRLVPMEDLTVESVLKPFDRKDDFVSIRIIGAKHAGKTQHKTSYFEQFIMLIN